MKNNNYGFIDMNCSSDKYFTNTSSEEYSFNKIKIRNYRTHDQVKLSKIRNSGNDL